MPIIGCDYHPGFQQIGFMDTETENSVSGDSSRVRDKQRSL